MSCVLRICNPAVDQAQSGTTLKPYRAEPGTQHFHVSDAEFDNLNAQIDDAVSFLERYRVDIQTLMAAPDAYGVLDFAMDTRAVCVQIDHFPASLVRAAGNLGLALELSSYSV